MTQFERGAAFRLLHERPGAFVIPNPWDAGTAQVLAGLGFEALATTSSGLAFTLGRRDAEGAVTREQALTSAGAIAAATSLPVSADLENGFGDDPETVAETIRMAAAIGLVGGSIEDATTRSDEPIYPQSQAVERVAAAAEAAHSLPFPFLLTARAENYLYGRRDLDDTIRRLQAYEAAGADVLYAPGLRAIEDVQAICAAVSRPVNVLAGAGFTVAQLAEAGVRRVSLGGALSRAALSAFLRAAREVRQEGSFGFLKDVVPFGDLNTFMVGRLERP
ncbi:MAG TPA: isocitrate lyase/phosphoenolpyruvate mutase family protein [Candidatus Dormibacteraeota bacterium]|nr:isocitrate lyase/phosphoenolpyruvate mutase family protein [Candidatus Dormibacteraeota bacterium]